MKVLDKAVETYNKINESKIANKTVEKVIPGVVSFFVMGFLNLKFGKVFKGTDED
jgi:hypothetical protein